jgi:hypothetical protein
VPAVTSSPTEAAAGRPEPGVDLPTSIGVSAALRVTPMMTPMGCDMRHKSHMLELRFHPLESQVAQGKNTQRPTVGDADTQSSAPAALARDTSDLQNDKYLLEARQRPLCGRPLGAVVLGGTR